MTLRTHHFNWLHAVLAVAVLAGCSSSVQRAPVMEPRVAEKKPVEPAVAAEIKKPAPREKDWRPKIYVVQKGDTLYGIAFNHGLDYHEIADLNNIKNPDMIRVGQEIRLLPDSAAAAIKPAPEIKPVVVVDVPVKSQPRAIKLPYSEHAVAELEKMQETPHKPEPVAVAIVEPKPELKSDSTTNNVTENDEDIVEWSMPTNGKVIGEFSESANRKGIDIAGKSGQAVVASAAGKVVYSGSSLRGYGKLVIIKHNKTYLSAYAHNAQILVKEGQNVTKGHKIAEMGDTDADQVKLHFEIRKFGKPVDPAKYLPLVKS